MTKMSRKNLMLLVLSVLLVIGAISAGCAGTETVAPPETPSQITEPATPKPEMPAQTGIKSETPTPEMPTATGSKIKPPAQPPPAQIIEDITPQEAFALIQNNQNNPDFIIDVRTPEEFAEGYIKDAINIDFYAETFRDELDKLDKNKTYLIYCRSGRRSGNALDMMAELNFREVYNILGGFNRWQAEGLEWEIEKAASKEEKKSTENSLEWKEEKIPTEMK